MIRYTVSWHHPFFFRVWAKFKNLDFLKLSFQIQLPHLEGSLFPWNSSFFGLHDTDFWITMYSFWHRFCKAVSFSLERLQYIVTVIMIIEKNLVMFIALFFCFSVYYFVTDFNKSRSSIHKMSKLVILL